MSSPPAGLVRGQKESMTTQTLKTSIASVLTTALETEPAAFPETMAYLATGANLSDWTTVKSIMTQNDLATFTGNAIALTDKGRALAKQIQEILGDAKRLREAATATKHPGDIAAYRDANQETFAKMATPAQANGITAACNAERDRQAAVRETATDYPRTMQPNPQIEGETFYRNSGNAFGITHVRPANSGMAYGLTAAGKIALIENPPGTSTVTGVIAEYATLAEARAEYFRRRAEARSLRQAAKPPSELCAVLMRRDGVTRGEAEADIRDARRDLAEMAAAGDNENAMEICADRWGLEPDYLMELIN